MTPRWYQTEAEKAAWDFLCTQPGSPVIVLPTGAGKSLVIAMLFKTAVEKFKGRVIGLAHRKELLNQNAEKIRALMPGLDVGIYSAGLKSRHTDHDVLLCGIQSVFRRAEEFGQRHLVVIDESHLVPSDGEGMYRTFLTDLRKYNPQLRMIGLTATPFRTGEGRVTGADKLFQKICYDAPIRRLIDEGFLCSVTNKVADATLDTSGLHIRGGEFINHEVERLFGSDDAVAKACAEIVANTRDRHSVLVFCSGVKHAERVAELLQSLTGERAGCVTGETLAIERAALLSDFKNQRLRFLTNCDVLTVGFDSPCTDAIAILRATASPGLFAQIVGRGFRVDSSKDSGCLILDFGENLQRHGAIDAPGYGCKAKEKLNIPGNAPVKTCPNCEEVLPASATECECGFLFPRTLKHKDRSDQESALLSEVNAPETWIVEEVHFSRHRKKKATPDDPDTLRVDYTCLPIDSVGGNLERTTISEWVCLDHEGFPRKKALRWWRERCRVDAEDIGEAVELWERGAVATPEQITTTREGKFFRVVGYQLDERPETWADEAVEVNFDTEQLAF